MAEVKVNSTLCVGCGSCMTVCPIGAIKYNAEGKAEIDQSQCIKCQTCASVCPMQAITAE